MPLGGPWDSSDGEDHQKFCSTHLELVSDQQDFKNTFGAINQQLKLQGLNRADWIFGNMCCSS